MNTALFSLYWFAPLFSADLALAIKTVELRRQVRFRGLFIFVYVILKGLIIFTVCAAGNSRCHFNVNSTYTLLKHVYFGIGLSQQRKLDLEISAIENKNYIKCQAPKVDE